MTKLAIRITLVFALAVTLALVGTVSNGYVMFLVAQHRVELSFNLFVLLLLLGYGVFHLLWRAIAFAVSLPERARSERAASEKQRAQSALLRSIAATNQGAHTQAERQAVEAAKHADFRATAQVLAGQAALQQGEHERAMSHFDLVKSADDVVNIACKIGVAETLIARGESEAALPPLKDALQFDGSQPKALTLRLEAFENLKRWDDALATLKEMRRAKTATAASLFAHEVRLHRLAIAAISDDSIAMSSYWHKLPDDTKRDIELMLSVVDWLLAKGAKGEARAVIETALPSRWDSRLAERYGDTAEANALSQIERAERWLLQHPKDPGLLVSLAKLCFAQGLWGKAQSYVDAGAALSAHPGMQTIAAQPALELTSDTPAHVATDRDRIITENIQRLTLAVQQLRAQLRERLMLNTLGT